MGRKGGVRNGPVACGECWKGRGSKRVYETLADLERHVTQAHPGLGFVPVKRVAA